MKQMETIGVRVPLLPRDATTREGVEIVLSAAMDLIEEMAQEKEADILWNHLAVKPDEETYVVREHGGGDVLRSSHSLTISVYGVREVEEEDE